ncbi:Hpt domain-containing protein [Pseudoalteromonas sp. SSDWG2]|uniref:Hpt domain-containing protein n=1 Tax=Pseudoalteromonas sp. SSDWG2 TaxID=3139391 RepID=UPI003BA98242
MEIKIDDSALIAMQGLLGDQFADTLEFCFSEFTRLHGEFEQSLNTDQNEAIRNIHSLKSNAAQFGAITLAETAREIEHGLTKGESQQLQPYIDALPNAIEQSIVHMKQWHQS